VVVAELLGWFGAALSCVISLPQVVRTLRAKRLDGISCATYWLVLVNASAWTAWSLLTGEYAAGVPALVNGPLAIVILHRLIATRHTGSSERVRYRGSRKPARPIHLHPTAIASSSNRSGYAADHEGASLGDCRACGHSIAIDAHPPTGWRIPMPVCRKPTLYRAIDRPRQRDAEGRRLSASGSAAGTLVRTDVEISLIVTNRLRLVRQSRQRSAPKYSQSDADSRRFA
jgi:uncharacterized protein with PQ loop repeat